MRTLSLLLTGLALVCVAVAVSPLGRAPAPVHDVVFLVDLSRSVTGGRNVGPRLGSFLRPELRSLSPQTRVWLMPFGGVSISHRRDFLVSQSGPIPGTFPGREGAATPTEVLADLERVLDSWRTLTAWMTRVDLALDQVGRMRLDDRTPATVMLVTDGHPADTASLDAARRLAARGHRVFTRAAPTTAAAGDLFLDRIEAPLQVRPGEPVHLRIAVAGTGRIPGDFRLLVREDGTDAAPVERRGRWEGRVPSVVGARFAGRRTIEPRTFTVRLVEPGAAPGHAETPGDALRLTVLVGSPVRVHWHGGGGLPRALRELGSGFSVETPEHLTDESLASADVVVIEEQRYGPPPLDDPGTEKLIGAVASGTGFLAVGARDAFGPGGWSRTPLEPILAVRPERPGPRADTTLLLDASGSMAAAGRWGRAVSAATSFADRMEPGDRLRVTTFAAKTREALPWRTLQSKARAAAGEISTALHRSIASQRPSGPTNLAPALEEALRGFTALSPRDERSEAPPRRRRLLVLSDGNLAEGEAILSDLGRRLRDARVRLGVVATGDSLSPAGRKRLEALTLAGGNGRILEVAAGDDLRRAFREAGNPNWWRGAVAVKAAAAAPGADPPELRGPFPPVGRLVVTTPRTDGPAVLLVDAEEGLPVLAVGRHGDGRIAAFPASLRHPGSGGWNRADRWRPVIRWLARGAGEEDRPLARGRVRGGRLRVDVRLPADAPLGGWSFTVDARARGGEPHRALWPRGPRQLSGSGPAPEPDVSTLALWRHGKRVATAAVRRDPGEELRRIGTNEAHLEALAGAGGGRFLAGRSGEDVGAALRDAGGTGQTGAPAAMWALLALILFLAGRGVKVLAAPGR